MRHNVLQLVGSFHQGGSEWQAIQLTRLLLESGRYNVFLATLEREGVLLDEVNRMGVYDIPEYRLTSFYNLNTARQLRLFSKHLIEHKIEIVHTHDFYTNIFGMAGAMFARVPVRIASRRESAVRPAKQRFVERCAYRAAHAVVANCEHVRKQLIREGVPRQKAHTLHNGLDLARLKPAQGFSKESVLSALTLPKTGPYITIVANMRAHVWSPEPYCFKDHPTFLQAAQRVHKVYPDAAFIVAGEGELKDKMQELAAGLGIGHQTFFIGRCEDVAGLLAISDICVLSSRAEGFSNSILEYMAAARPVVATDVGGAREAVLNGETGYIVPAGNDEQLANRIVALLNNPQLARMMGERGHAIARERFSCEHQLQLTEALYDQLLVSGSRGHARQGESVVGVNISRS